MTASQHTTEAGAPLCLRELRTQLGISQKELAKKMGTTPQFVSRLEKGSEKLSIEQANNLCITLDCSAEQLLASINGAQRQPARRSRREHTEIRYGTLKAKMTFGTRNYPISEYARASILLQLRSINNPRLIGKVRRLIYCVSLDNRTVLLNPRNVEFIELISDDVEAMPKYYSPDIYRALDDLDTGDYPDSIRNECESIIKTIGEDEITRMVSCVRVTYDSGEDQWNFLDHGSAITIFGLEAATFNVASCTFAEIEEEGYYRGRYTNLDHVAVVEVPTDRYHKLTRSRPKANRRSTMPLPSKNEVAMSTV
ncbi:MAG: XRE family transcriptional regulator [Mesorhizobium sp.]|uniref:helix-turn-helix transcriptional regulator n=1 Tax=Mesorhizobium sp. TaxID=1871066 RepID=UPI000FE5337B|nr:helix-turn-helix transcriptional regulator [Mesorhizobium sp.]RWB79153.1 MAG: XRE family transcriptional regulator [Mesorhizobium sp.]